LRFSYNRSLSRKFNLRDFIMSEAQNKPNVNMYFWTKSSSDFVQENSEIDKRNLLW